MDRDSIAPLFEDATYAADTAVPPYLMRHYWWAYVHPRAVKIFDRGWLINLILLTNYRRLVREALQAFQAPRLGRVLQIACVYGDLTPELARTVAAAGGTLDVVDVLPIQLRNLKWKLPVRTPARLLRMDSTALDLPDARYDHVLLFFLLHEQPEAIRRQTMAEALRVLKPGGTRCAISWHRSWRCWNPSPCP